MPDETPTVAIEVLLLLQVPPAVASLRFITRPAHPLANPDIAAGNGLVVKVVVAVQPAGNV